MATDYLVGDLQDLTLSALFIDLSARSASGALSITRSGVTKTIYFEKGRMIYADSTSLNDRLGSVLIRRGRLRISDFLRVQQGMKPGKKLGTLLVEEGLLPAEQLMSAVIEQVRLIILSLFEWDEGTFTFTPESEHPKGILHLELPVREIVREGIRRIDNAIMLINSLGDLNTRFRLSSECGQLLEGWEIGDRENHILVALGEPTTFIALSELNVMNDVDLARFLWALRTLGIVTPVNEPDDSKGVKAGELRSDTPLKSASHLDPGQKRPESLKPAAKADTEEAFDRITVPGKKPRRSQ